MSRENVETVRRTFETWEARDLSGMLALLHDDLVTRRHPPLPDPGTWHGPEEALDAGVAPLTRFFSLLP
jgi:ketosteroid isomerase-like protein